LRKNKGMTVNSTIQHNQVSTLISFIVFSTNTVCTVTGYTLMLISVVQFFSVAYPLRCRNIVTRRCAVFISVLTWLCCIVLLTVIPLFFLNEKKRIVDEECTLEIIFRGNMEKVRKSQSLYTRYW
jgi:hypothetical protein